MPWLPLPSPGHEARELFAQWRSLREASWTIRERVEEESLSIDDPTVRDRIRAARRLRDSLLAGCRAYLSELADRRDAVRFEVGEHARVRWSEPVRSIRRGDRYVVPIVLTNRRDRHVHVRLRGGPSDQVLFWSKDVSLPAGGVRHTFAVLAPTRTGRIAGTVRLEGSGETAAEVSIAARGVPSDVWAPFYASPDQASDAPRRGGEGGSPGDRFDPSIRLTVRDADTGGLIPARIQVIGEDGRRHWSPLRGPTYAVEREESGWRSPLWRFQPGPFFYADGRAELGVEPAGKRIRVHRGFEYRPAERTVPPDGVVTVDLERWIDMADRGWYSGQTHIHTTEVGMPVYFSRHWPLVTRAEDVRYSSILTLKGEWESHAIYADEYPMGPVPSASTEEHLVSYGEEYRNNPYGHLALLGLDRLIQPVSSGALGELAGPDYPPNAFVLDEARDQDAVTVGAHFGNYVLEEKPIRTPWPSTGFEMPVDVALGKIEVAEIYGNGGQRAVWYRLLNCGFEIPATAGPDWVMKDTPRTYVYLGDRAFTGTHWLEGLREGRSFITRGSMLFFRVEGRRAGATLHYADRPRELRVEASALAPDGHRPVEIVVDGRVVARSAEIDTAITISDSGWIAARTEGAHSNPVYVRLAGRAPGYAAPARRFLEVVDRLSVWVRREGLFETAAQEESVLRVLERGRGVYESIVARAERMDRPASPPPH